MLPIIVALLSFALPEPVVSEIPLSDMYGHDIPGTKDVFDLYDVPALREKLVSSFSQRVHAGPVLIMLGPPKHTAKMVALMHDGVYSPQRQFTESQDMCLVVCSYASGAQFIL
jgi:hypothetical protein